MRSVPLSIFFTFFLLSARNIVSAESLSAVVEKVARQNPDLKGARARIDGAESEFGGIRSLRYPRLAVRSSFMRGDNPVYVFGSLLEQQAFGPQNFAIESLNNPSDLTNIKNALDLGVPLFMAFEVSTGEKIRRWGIAQAQEQLGAIDQSVRFQAINGYLVVLWKQDLWKALTDRVEAAQKEVEDARRLNAKGLVLGSDFYAAQAIFSSLRAQQIQCQKELDAAKKRLGIMMGEPSEVVNLSGSLSPSGYSVEKEEALIAQALATRRDVKEADLLISMAEENVGQSGRSLLPKIEAFASLETNTEDFESNPTNRTVGVRSYFPIGDPTYFSRKANAQAEARAARSRKEGVEESIRQEVTGALHIYEGALSSLPLVQEAVGQAEKSLELFRPLYREGRQSILDVLRAEEGLVRAQQALYENLYHLHSGFARLLLVTGKLEPSSIKEIENQLVAQP